MRWFLADGTYELGFNAPVPTSAGGDGLTLAVFSNNNNARAFIDLLASKTDVKFLSAPQVMVLDNNTANIRVAVRPARSRRTRPRSAKCSSATPARCCR